MFLAIRTDHYPFGCKMMSNTLCRICGLVSPPDPVLYMLLSSYNDWSLTRLKYKQQIFRSSLYSTVKLSGVRTRGGNCSPGSSRLYRLGVSQASKSQGIGR